MEPFLRIELRSTDYKTVVIPLYEKGLERVSRFELEPVVWKTNMLPLNTILSWL